mgnify:CR=1 FL=1
MRDVKATGKSRGENENGGIRVGSRLGKKGRLCRKTFVRLLCLTAAMMVLGSFTAFARAGGASGGGGGGTQGTDEIGIGHVVDRGDQHADDGGDSQRGHQVGDGGLGHLGKFVFGRMKDGQRCHSQRMRMIQYSIV